MLFIHRTLLAGKFITSNFPVTLVKNLRRKQAVGGTSMSLDKKTRYFLWSFLAINLLGFHLWEHCRAKGTSSTRKT